MGHDQALRVGQFSMQILGQFWVQINSPAISPTIPEGSPTPTPVDVNELRERIAVIEAELNALKILLDQLDPPD